ncbi:MAG: UDP-glucose dehydrogenase family protein [Pseudobdellovibrionaceae bacterium]
MKISVFGTGYVGLVTGVCFAEMGNDVWCADIDETKISKLKNGISPIYEPGLDDLIVSNVKSGRLKFTTDLKAATNTSEILFIAVGTPSDVDGSADLKYVLQVARQIAENAETGKTVVTKSTVPVGTYLKVKNEIQTTLTSMKKNLKFDVVSNPEFLREGSAVEDCLKPARVVVGVESADAEKLMRRLYEPFLKSGHPILVMDPLSSEMTKYAANAMLATKISLMNEFSRVCEKVGADIENVRRGIGSDPRIGPHFIYAGVGYGGSCFPKDVKALVHTGMSLDLPMEILNSVEKVNQSQREKFISKIEKRIGGFKNKTLALWGVAFKPGTDDIREAPALDLIQRVLDGGGKVQAFDDVAQENTIAEFKKNPNLQFFENQYDVLRGADCLCLMTEWKSFREPDFEKFKKDLKSPLIFDGRNIYSITAMKEMGFEYHSIGRVQK